jgi:gamma-glutamyltranspeptidase/glutathione hydrolase
MINSIRGTRGMATAPHALAAQSAVAVMREGGNALEAMIAAAATVAVVYPHMNSIGGDSFWLIHTPGSAAQGVDGAGASAQAATREWYRGRGIATSIPFRGGVAANTVAGTISAWAAAFERARSLGGKLPLSRLLDDAIHYAANGIPVTSSQADATAAKRAELEPQPGFAQTFLPNGAVPTAGSRFVQPRMAETLRRLAKAGLDDFYRGELAQAQAADLASAGSPITLSDLQSHRAQWTTPLVLEHSLGRIYNLPAPTQGVVSLAILGMLDRLGIGKLDPAGADFVHLAVECTKLAFRRLRDPYITDPAHMKVDAQSLLSAALLDELISGVDPNRAAPWGQARAPADTVWMGVVDGEGRAVSFIQSLYHEFGSGVVLSSTGVTWQNRGCSFSLDPKDINALLPGKKPFHTLNPALALFHDGRTMVYGNMGGDGQPQTQSAVFSRVATFGMHPQAAISAPRWLLGRTWGQLSDTLKLESRFGKEVITELKRRGHEVELLGPFDETVGHAGAIVRHVDGVLEGGADPRSDGAVAAF